MTPAQAAIEAPGFSPGRFLRTVTRLRPAQIGWRLLRMAQQPFAPGAARRCGPGAPGAFDAETLSRLRVFMEDAASAGLSASRGSMDALRGGHPVFLNRTASVTGYSWHDATLPKLWRYQLHGFRWLAMLALENTRFPRPEDRTLAREALLDWMRNNPPGVGDGWEPFPVSERILHWAPALAVLAPEDPELRASVEHQARWLARRFEWDLQGNHLLKNACALAVAGAVLGDAALLARGAAEAVRQFDRQVLPDGGHFERSPMYHALALWDGLVLQAVLGEQHPAGEHLRPVLLRMADFLRGVAHPDGDIPLFNDAVLGEAFPARALADFAAHRCGGAVRLREDFPDSGVYALGNSQGRMLVKASPVPSDQPGHAHGDPLTIELSTGTTRMLVDAGCHGYAESPLRGWCRSVRAHNTAVVDGVEPVEAWSVFRVGHRHGPPSARVERRADGARFTGEVVLPGGAVHRREILCLDSAPAWRVRDAAVRRDGGPASLVALLHMPPETTVSVREDGAVLLRRDVAVLLILPESGTGVSAHLPGKGDTRFWYCPRFGVSDPAPTVEVTPLGEGEGRCGVWLCPPEAEDAVRAWMKDNRD